MSRKRNKPHRLPLSPEKRIEVARTFDALDRSGLERGLHNESFAQKICKNFVAKGLIEYFWAIPQRSGLDYKGIDIVCQTGKGYYFLNVKSSVAGVDSFHAKRSLLKKPLFDIFPWLVIPYRGEAEAEGQLEGFLKRAPSCDILSQEVLEGLVGLTPNTVLANNMPLSVGRREQRLKSAVESEKTAKMARAKLRKKRNMPMENLLSALSGSRSWRFRFEELGKKGICSIKKWNVLGVINDGRDTVEWTAEIEIEVKVLGNEFIVKSRAVSTTKKGAQNSAAENVAKEIRSKI